MFISAVKLGLSTRTLTVMTLKWPFEELQFSAVPRVFHFSSAGVKWQQ